MKLFIQASKPVSKNIEFRGEAILLLKKFNLNPETVLIIKNGELVNHDEILENKDEVKILSVVSGG